VARDYLGLIAVAFGLVAALCGIFRLFVVDCYLNSLALLLSSVIMWTEVGHYRCLEWNLKEFFLYVLVIGIIPNIIRFKSIIHSHLKNERRRYAFLQKWYIYINTPPGRFDLKTKFAILWNDIIEPRVAWKAAVRSSKKLLIAKRKDDPVKLFSAYKTLSSLE